MHYLLRRGIDSEGEARRRYEDAVGVSRVAEKMAVNLPPMLNTREGKLLAVEVCAVGVCFEDKRRSAKEG